MSESKWTVATAEKFLLGHGGKVERNVIHHKKPGLKGLGAIDFLVNHNNYVWIKREGK